jgi:hypothetical protein
MILLNKFENLSEQEFFGMYEILLSKDDLDAKSLFKQIKSSTLKIIDYKTSIASIKCLIIWKGWKDVFSINYLKDLRFGERF